ncbi:MAG: hypothetical protein HGB04_09640, partial [Chlorobiaceae bacterium]|nr:hypothetical protein [Chlorobiaceae bacterium]
ESASVLTSPTASGATGTNVGSYTNTASGNAADGNYNLTFVNGALTIGRASATVTGNSASGTYSGVAQGVSGFTVTGLVNNESASVLTSPTASGATGTNVGSYTNTASGNAADGNYNLTYVDGGLRIGKAHLTVTPDNVAKRFGKSIELTAYGVAGLQNGETVGSVTLSSEGAKAFAPLSGSPYDIIASNAGGGTFDAANYQIAYNRGLLTVLPGFNTPVDSSILAALDRLLIPVKLEDDQYAGGLTSVRLVLRFTPERSGVIVVMLPAAQLMRDFSFWFPLPHEVAAEMPPSTETLSMADGRSLPGWLAYRRSDRTFVAHHVPQGDLPVSLIMTSGKKRWQVIITNENQKGPM